MYGSCSVVNKIVSTVNKNIKITSYPGNSISDSRFITIITNNSIINKDCIIALVD